MTELETRAQRATELLRQTVAEALERKRRLGQYAVVYKDGKLQRLEGEKLHPSS